MTITIETRTRSSLCTTVYLPGFLVTLETVRLDLERLTRSVFSQTRKPPRNALSLSPARLPEGSPFSFFTLPPPRTTSSGSRAATRRFTTSVTKLRHFFLPYFFIPRIRRSLQTSPSCKAGGLTPSARRCHPQPWRIQGRFRDRETAFCHPYN